MKKPSNQKFFEAFNDVFQRNARWSRHLLPDCGNENSTYDEVNDFYSAWYDFESWREFTYEKLEDLEKCEDRWERRGYQMQIKKENNQKRKEETRRIRKLVDNAYNSDHRIAKFRKEELEKKEAEKNRKKAEREAKKAAELKAENDQKEKERLEQEKIEAEAYKQKQADKKEKEQAKKQLKRARQNFKKTLRDLFSASELQNLSDEITLVTLQLEVLDLDNLNKQFTDSKNKAECQKIIVEKYQTIKEELNADTKKAEEEKMAKQQAAKKEKDWATEDLQILLKAANIFPAGTVKRWDKLAAYVNDHSAETSPERSAKDCMAAVKKLGEKSKDGGNAGGQDEDSFSQFLRQKKHQNESKPLNNEISVNYSAQETTTKSTSAPKVKQESKAWSPVEQKHLEQALKTFPASLGKERWAKIAENVPGRSMKECVMRYKEIVAAIQAKKKAEQKVAGKK